MDIKTGDSDFPTSHRVSIGIVVTPVTASWMSYRPDALQKIYTLHHIMSEVEVRKYLSQEKSKEKNKGEVESIDLIIQYMGLSCSLLASMSPEECTWMYYRC